MAPLAFHPETNVTSNKTTPTSEPDREFGKEDFDDFENCLQQLVREGSFPSFDEFSKNPDKWREHPEEILATIERSMQGNRKDLAKQKHYWRYGKEHFSLGKLARVCAENGYKLSEVDMIPFRSTNTSGTGKDEIFVRVFPKTELQKMGAIIPNAK